ncbi:helix-hairpin-helix domain-containing protein [Streptomyces sp. NPDC050418]|uniref:helix-hairpin-helix domain-containing protein n=1 Tax=Streptomyces sp. NPDC050418 TaxID=3365612 RepID=UPI0037B695B9
MRRRRRREHVAAERVRRRAARLFDQPPDSAVDAASLPRWDGPAVPRWAVDRSAAEAFAARTRERSDLTTTVVRRRGATTVVRRRGTAADEGVRGSSSSAVGELDSVGVGVGAGAGAGVGAQAAEGADWVAAPAADDTWGEPDVDNGRPERWRSAVRERLPLWLQTRCGLERRSVIVLMVLLVAGAAFAVQHFWLGRPQPVGAPDVVRAAPAVSADVDTGGDAGAADGPGGAAGDRSADPTGAGGLLVVDIGGKVREPGVHRLPLGSRVADALRAAGGAKPGTDLSGLNRARLLVDGEQVVVGAPPGAQGAGSTAVPGGAAPAGPVSLNSATADQLDTLPGVGPVLAQHIIDYRTQNGGFRSVDELREVNGIGDRRFADLKDAVRP